MLGINSLFISIRLLWCVCCAMVWYLCNYQVYSNLRVMNIFEVYLNLNHNREKYLLIKLHEAM